MRGGQKSGASRLKASACQCFNLRTADLNGKHSEKSAGRKCPPSLGMAGGNRGGQRPIGNVKVDGRHTYWKEATKGNKASRTDDGVSSDRL